MRTILTTTPSTSHISNFRNQPRSDSRAYKPDTFPGFDLQDDSTPSSVHRRRQAYSHLLRSFIQKTRERIETIREVARHERVLAQAKRLAMSNNINAINPVLGDNDEPIQIVDLTSNKNSDDDNDDDDDAQIEEYLAQLNSATDNMSNENDESAPKKYFTTLLTTAGLQTVMYISPNDESESVESPSNEPSFIAAYVFNPLTNLWKTARNNFNLNYLNVFNGSGSAYATTTASINESNSYTNTNNGENNDEEIAFNPPDNMLNGNATVFVYTNNANHSLPFKLNANTANMKEIVEEKSHFERATLAFQNAFYKYAGVGRHRATVNDNNNGNGNDNDDAIDVNEGQSDREDDDAIATATAATTTTVSAATATEITEKISNNSHSFQALPLTEAHSPNVNLTSYENHTQFYGIVNNNTKTTKTSTESPNIQIIPSHQNLIMKQQNNRTLMAAIPNAAESAGIYVLEIVGTVVGLTWGAFSQMQNWFNKKS